MAPRFTAVVPMRSMIPLVQSSIWVRCCLGITKSITGTHVNLLTMAMMSLSIYLIRAGSAPFIISQKTQYGGLFNVGTSIFLKIYQITSIEANIVFPLVSYRYPDFSVVP